MSTNPYESYLPAGVPPPPADAPDTTPSHVMAPAVALTIVGIIDFLQSLYGFARNLSGLNRGGPPPRNVQDKPELLEIYNAVGPYKDVINMTLSVLAIFCAVLIIVAGIQMMRRKMYPLCLTGSILAAIPCLSFLACCLVGEGVGIWAFLVLLQQDVKRSFL